MDAARIPWAWRDYCAHLLIPLNKCRRLNAYLPWACHHEKHVYEKCQYKVWDRNTWAGPGMHVAYGVPVDQLVDQSVARGPKGAKHTDSCSSTTPP